MDDAPAAEQNHASTHNSARFYKQLPQDIRDKGRLTVVMGDYKKPSYFRDKNGKLVGMNVDLAKALEEQLGVNVKIALGTFDSVLAGIQAKRYDTAIYNMSDTPERRQVVDFVDYAKSGSIIITRAGEATLVQSPSDLCGLKVAVKSGQVEQQIIKDTSHKCVQDGKPAITIQAYQDDGSIQQSLLSKRSDVELGGMPAAPLMVKEHPDRFAVAKAGILISQPLGMPFLKDRRQLTKAFAAAMQQILKSGEYEKIADKWGLSAMTPDRISINDGHGLG